MTKTTRRWLDRTFVAPWLFWVFMWAHWTLALADRVYGAAFTSWCCT